MLSIPKHLPIPTTCTYNPKRSSASQVRNVRKTAQTPRVLHTFKQKLLQNDHLPILHKLLVPATAMTCPNRDKFLTTSYVRARSY